MWLSGEGSISRSRPGVGPDFRILRFLSRHDKNAVIERATCINKWESPQSWKLKNELTKMVEVGERLLHGHRVIAGKEKCWCPVTQGVNGVVSCSPKFLKEF